MTNLSGVSAEAAMGLTSKNDSATKTNSEKEVEKTLQRSANAIPTLAYCGRGRSIVHEYRQSRGTHQEMLDVDSFPPGNIGGMDHLASFEINRTRQRHSDAADLLCILASVLLELVDIIQCNFQRLLRLGKIPFPTELLEDLPA